MNYDKEIYFLKKLLDDHMEHFDAEEQHRLINLIQKLILERDKENRK